ncbi:hypothetical protein BDZ91DRAFT_633764, partial [Kalaharituber pfeilii]
YRALPEFRLSYLSQDEINHLLSHFMAVPFRTDILMMRYLSIIDDMRYLHIPVSRKEWITAISYVGQRLNLKVGIPEIEATLKLWKELETQAGAEPGATLYNILLDMASKAKQHNLVCVLLDLMKEYGIQQDRFTYTTVMAWLGSIKDAKAAKEQYQRLVKNGEVVDTVIYNALITALIRSSEFDTAEVIFRKMKALGRDRDTLAYRRFGKHLRTIAAIHKRRVGLGVPYPVREASRIYCGPNIVTFNIFLHNYCKGGDFTKVTSLLAEMKEFEIPMEASIFISLFRGFTLHGTGHGRFSKWTVERIEEVYAALLREVGQVRKDDLQEVKISTVLACEVVKAFAMTTMSRRRTIEVYRDM